MTKFTLRARRGLRPNTILIAGAASGCVYFTIQVLEHFVSKDFAVVLFWVVLPFLLIAFVLISLGYYRFAQAGKW